jgi:hypothetical protein
MSREIICMKNSLGNHVIHVAMISAWVHRLKGVSSTRLYNLYSSPNVKNINSKNSEPKQLSDDADDPEQKFEKQPRN